MNAELRARLLTATAFAAAGMVASQSVDAQTAPGAADQAGAAQVETSPSSGAPQSIQPVTPEDILRDIVVTGRKRSIAGGLMIVQREPETTNSISAEAIAQKAGIAGPYQLIATLPGVNTGQSDPYQMSIRYGLFLRGLPQTDIGWVIEGAPGIDQAYQNPYSETWADSENLAGVTVLPGSTRITDPVQTAVGGEIIETIRDPYDASGAKVSYSHGSYRANRYFGEIDTGLIGSTGIKAFGSVSYTKAGTFALPDDAYGDRLHADFKVAKDWGDLGKSTIFASYNDWNVLRSQPYSLAQFRADQQTGDFTVGNYLATFNPLSNTNNYYKDAIYTRRNVLVSSNNELHITDRLTIVAVPYYHWTRSNSPGESTLNPASVYAGTQKQTISTVGLFLLPNGLIPVKTSVLQNMTAYGLNSYAKYEVADGNHLQVGWWHDHFSMRQLNSFSNLSVSGLGADYGGSPLYSTSGQIISGAQFNLHTDIDALSIQDAQSLFDDKMTIEAGLKYFHNTLFGNNLVPGAPATFGASYHKFLPRATISYDIDSKSQVYADIVTETRTNVPITTYPNTYNIGSGTISQLGNNAAVPEYSVGEEIGYRFHDGFLTADIAAFNKKLSNHSVVSLAFLNGAGVNTAINAGGLLMRGVTAEFALRPFFGFSPYVNAQYLHTETTSNLQVGNDFLPTAGKEGVEAPKWTVTSGLNYNHGPFFGNVLLKYNSSQFATFMNDQKMPAYTTVDLGAGYRLPPGFAGKDATFRISVTNIGNKPYLSTFSSVTPNAVTTTGVNGTTIAGSSPSYWLGSPRAILGTFSTSF